MTKPKKRDPEQVKIPDPAPAPVNPYQAVRSVAESLAKVGDQEQADQGQADQEQAEQAGLTDPDPDQGQDPAGEGPQPPQDGPDMPEAPNPLTGSGEPAKRKGGRPKGSRTRPSAAQVIPPAPPAPPREIDPNMQALCEGLIAMGGVLAIQAIRPLVGRQPLQSQRAIQEIGANVGRAGLAVVRRYLPDLLNHAEIAALVGAIAAGVLAPAGVPDAEIPQATVPQAAAA